MNFENVTSVECLYLDKNKIDKQLFVLSRINDKKHVFKIDSSKIKRYFYAPQDENIVDKNILATENFYNSFDGKKLKKLVIDNISKYQFEELTKKFSESYEVDVDYKKRFIIDNNIQFAQKQRICYLDIETDLGLDIVETDKAIISITVYDNFKDTFYCFIWRKDLFRHDVAVKGQELRYFKSEVEMLKNFFSFMSQSQFDVITGWFISGFDIPYIIGRSRKLKLRDDCEKLSPLYFEKISMGLNNSLVYSIVTDKDGVLKSRDEILNKIYGVEIVDLINIYDKLTYEGRPDNLRLNTVANHLLGQGKAKADNIQKMWTDRMGDLITYNIQDVKLCVDIDKKAHLLDYFFNVQQIIPIPLESVMFNSRVLDYYILKTYHNKYVFPTKKLHEKVDALGAFAGKLKNTTSDLLIKEILKNKEPFYKNGEDFWFADYPEARKYENIAVLDFSGMYSNIYRTFNISPETINSLQKDIIIDEVSIDLNKVGLIPQLITKVLEERKKAQKLRDAIENHSSEEYAALDNLQGGFKTILNSLYGSMGYPSFRLYNPNILKTILIIARELLVEVNKIAANAGFNVIYSDTDSCFIQLKFGTIEESKKLNQLVNEQLEKYILEKYKVKQNYMSLDCEKIFKNLVFTGVKKAYVGLLRYKKGYEVNELFSRGLSIVRKDTPLCIKNLMKEIYKKLLNGENPKDVKTFLESEKRKIKNLSLWEIGITKTITKLLNEYTTNCEHIRAAKFSNEFLKTNFTKSDSPKMIFVKNLSNNAILIDEDTVVPKNVEVDYDKLFDLVITNKLQMFEHVEGLNISSLYSQNKNLMEYL